MGCNYNFLKYKDKYIIDDNIKAWCGFLYFNIIYDKFILIKMKTLYTNSYIYLKSIEINK